MIQKEKNTTGLFAPLLRLCSFAALRETLCMKN